jgi:hypothetical protein
MSAAQICEQTACDLTGWVRENPDHAHVRSPERPDSPQDRTFWQEVEDDLHRELEATVLRVVANHGGPVPPAFGTRNLGPRV